MDRKTIIIIAAVVILLAAVFGYTRIIKNENGIISNNNIVNNEENAANNANNTVDNEEDIVNSNNNENVSQNNVSSNISKAKYTAIECMDKLSIDNTVEEINEIIGVQGELVDEEYNEYYWEITEDTGIEVIYYSGTKGRILLDVGDEYLADNSVDFSRYDELKNKVNDGIKYNEFISYLGNSKGTIVEKSSITTKYRWVDSEGDSF